ncbi:MAG: thrombospondin type 3 repeat-containing protein [Candidatus Peribacteria bacterium]|nr:thrombospondin type 3 repeat-containing protein [Candidatus Peribacteria bacterium]
MNGEVFKKHIGVCTLDNCPFTSNSDQIDINNTGIGDVCEDIAKDLITQTDTNKNTDLQFKYDQDKDGVSDTIDICPSIPGPLEQNGCPVLNGESTLNQGCETPAPGSCGNGIPEPNKGETCSNCPEDMGACSAICGNNLCNP